MDLAPLAIRNQHDGKERIKKYFISVSDRSRASSLFSCHVEPRLDAFLGDDAV